MITSIVLIALIGTFQFNSAISAAINYEPIKITVNENFNAQPGQVSPASQESAVLHQGANFFFKPHLNLQPSYIPSHIEALISLIQQHHHSCAKDTSKVVVEKDKVVEILKPFMYPLLDISKETLSEIVLEKENNLEIVKPIMITEEPKHVTPELLVISEAPVLPPSSFNAAIVEEEVKKEESIILEESTGVFPKITEIAARPITEPIINYGEPKLSTSGFVVIPEAPVLPPLSLNDIHAVEEEVKIEEPIIFDVESKPAIQEFVKIPEAPVLPSLSLHDISSIIEGEVKKEESIILKEPTGVFPTIPKIAVRPIEEKIIHYVEPKPITSELVVIPEAPVLPPIILKEFPSVVEEEVKKKESIIFEESTGLFPKITNIAARPINGEPKPFLSGLAVIPEAPVLPPLSLNDIHAVEEVKIEEPLIVNIEPKPAIQELVEIPEAPVLPSLSFHDISSIIKEDVRKEESIILEKPTGVFPTIPEIAVRPIEEPIFSYVEPKSITSELVLVPEAPVLPPLTLNKLPSVVKEEVKNKESIILEESTRVIPTITEIVTRPITEPIINYSEPKPSISGLVVIPEAPVLPSLSLNNIHAVEKVIIEEPLIVNVEPKPAIQELVEIPEAPVLPSHSFHDISSIIEEEVRKEESIILEKPTGVFPTIPEKVVRPIEEPIFNYVEPKPITSELVVIPEAPVLPPLTLNRFPSVVKEEVKKEESIILEESMGVIPKITEIVTKPITEPIINYGEPKPSISRLVVIPEAPVLPSLSLNDIHAIEEEVKYEEPLIVNVEPKSAIQELVEIPEAPVLPSLSFHDISSIIEEEVKKEESRILEESTRVFPTITEIATRPITESIINYGEPKPTTSGRVIIPEAPVLPQLSLSDIHVIEEELKIEESNMIDVEPKPANEELVEIPEAPVLPSQSYNGISPVDEEVKIEEAIKVEESTGVYLLIPEISARPFPEPLENNKLSETAESFALENNIFPVATEEVKIEIPILLEESIEVFPPIAEISSGPTLQESSLEITDSYVLEEVSQPNTESVVTVKETLPPIIIPKPSNHQGVFSYVPFVSHLSNRAPKTKKLMIPKPASLERFLLKKHPFILPVTPFPKLDLNAIKSSVWGNKKQFLYPTSYAHDVVEKRIGPNMAFKKQNSPKRVKIYIRSNVPKGPSYM